VQDVWLLRTTPFGRIAFANSDLAGIMDHRASILEARRAVGQTIDLFEACRLRN
jgi:spermidine dehydrogenase